MLPFGPPPGRADIKIWGASDLKEHNSLAHQEEDLISEEEAAPLIGRMTAEPSWGWISSLLILLLTVIAFVYSDASVSLCK